VIRKPNRDGSFAPAGHRSAGQTKATIESITVDGVVGVSACSPTTTPEAPFNQAKETVQAKVDETKQDIRKNT
jgi:hypothetical protein